METLLRAEGFGLKAGNISILKDINFEIHAGEIVAVVGEDESGKTALAQSLLRLFKEGWKPHGQLLFDDVNILDMNEHDIWCVRAIDAGLVFQNPRESLNPSMRIKHQITLPFEKHPTKKANSVRLSTYRLLDILGIHSPEEFGHKYPGDITDEMAQKAAIAMVLGFEPRLIILDEASATDAEADAALMPLIIKVAKIKNSALLFFTRKMELASKYAEKLAIMHEGTIVEFGAREQLLKSPQHHVSHMLVNSDITIERGKTQTAKRVILSVKGLTKRFSSKRVLDNISFDVYEGEIVGIAGKSGAGKSLLARVAAGITAPGGGTVTTEGRRAQMIFQDPHSSLNPRMKVGDIVAEGWDIAKKYQKEARDNMIKNQLEMVGMNAALAEAYPAELSKGMLQRVSIARAVAVSPSLLICDEPTGHLDTLAGVQIMELIARLRQEAGVTVIICSQNTQLLENICDRVIHLSRGHIVQPEPEYEPRPDDFSLELLLK